MSKCPTAAADIGQNNHLRSSGESVKCQLVERGGNHFYSLCFTYPHEERHQMFDTMSQEMWESIRLSFPVEP